MLYNAHSFIPKFHYCQIRCIALGVLKTSKGFLGFSVPSIIRVGAGLCKSVTTQVTRLRFLLDRRGNPSNRTRLIKLQYFTWLPEATSMSREELSPELSMDSEDVENVASSFFA